MTDDELMVIVRAARPAPAPQEESPLTAQAGRVWERAVATRRSRLAGRLGAWAVPAIGSAAAVAVAVVAVAVLGRHHPGTARPATPQSLTAGQYVFALGGGADQRLLFHADEVLRQRCMRARGLRYVLAPPPAGLSSALPAVGLPSTFYPEPVPGAYPEVRLLAFRSRAGFGLHAVVAGHLRVRDPNERYLSALPAAQQKRWRQAFIGRGGCRGTAAARLYGSRRAADVATLVPSLLYDHLTSLVYDRSGNLNRHAARTAGAAAAWSECMRRATRRAWPDEGHLIDWLAHHPPRVIRTAHFGALERSLATTDTRCAYSTDQAQTFAQVFRAGADRLPAATQGQLRFVLAHRAAWVARARAVLR